MPAMSRGTSLRDRRYAMNPVDPWFSQQDIPWPVSQNNVIVVNMNCRVDFKQATAYCPYISWKECRLSAATIRWYTPDKHCHAPIAQVPNSCIAVFMASKDPRMTLMFIHFFRTLLSNIPCRKGRPRNGPMSVCNKVSSGRFDPLNVSTFEDKDKTRIVKNTKSFSGVPYTVILPWGQRISFSIFSTGRFIVAGLDMKACKRAFPYVLAVLYRNKLAAEHRIPSADLTVACVRRMYLNQYKDGDCVIDSMKGAIEQAEKEVVVREDILKQILENNKKRAKRPTEDDDTEDFKIQRIR